MNRPAPLSQAAANQPAHGCQPLGATSTADAKIGDSISKPSPRCPSCGSGALSYRVMDEDTGCSYPLDDGEHFCRACDTVWTDADVARPKSRWASMSLAERDAEMERIYAKVDAAFKNVPHRLSGWALAEQSALRRTA